MDAVDYLTAEPDGPMPTWEIAMREIADSVRAELLKAPPDDPARLAARITARLCRELGGARFYWPRGDAMDRAARDLEIRAAHDGTADGPRGVRALARQYGLSEVHVWRILARRNAKQTQRRADARKR